MEAELCELRLRAARACFVTTEPTVQDKALTQALAQATDEKKAAKAEVCLLERCICRKQSYVCLRAATGHDMMDSQLN